MHSSRGFTLLELIIVVAVISLIMLVVAPNVLDTLDRGRRSSTQADMRALATALERYAADHRGYPTAVLLSDLRSEMVPRYIKSLPTTDGWGHPLIYEAHELGAGYSLRSPGKDGVFQDIRSSDEWNSDLVIVDGAFLVEVASDDAVEPQHDPGQVKGARPS